MCEVLKEAEIASDEAKYVDFIGLDFTAETDKPYTVSLPLKMCLDERTDIMLCWKMNGKTLT